jgi:glycolate oxidase FAD binding subunit
MADLLADLADRCPGCAPRPAWPADAVAGVPAEVVASPSSTAEVAEVVRIAAGHRAVMVARGAGTKLDWGAPPRSLQLVVDLSRLDRLLEHASGDLVARVEAGTPLAALDEALAGAGQRLPVDEVVPGSSIGGAVATNLCGPLRYREGAVRDLVTGLTVVRPDGVIARAGSKVVKNVAGYDLCKLYTGSYGTLGIVTEVTVRLRPRAAARRILAVVVSDEAELAPPLAGVLSSQADPSAIELDRPQPDGPITLAVLLEGRPGPLATRARALAGPLGASGASGEDGAAGEPGGEPPPWWGRLPGELTLKAAVPLGSVVALLGRVRALGLELGLGAAVRGSAGTGVLFIGLEPVPGGWHAERLGPVAALLAGLRRFCSPLGGSVTVLRSPQLLGEGIDLWGEVPGLSLMRRVKEQFDPQQLMAPGRFVGGI